jgi:hypothetical protein
MAASEQEARMAQARAVKAEASELRGAGNGGGAAILWARGAAGLHGDLQQPAVGR